MIRLSLGALLALAVPYAAAAAELSSGQSEKPRADTHCAALGQGFFPVTGSNTCVKISGHISAGVAFANGGAAPVAAGPGFARSSASGFDTEAVVNGDFRFDTPSGPGRIYVGVRKDTNPSWATNGQ